MTQTNPGHSTILSGAWQYISNDGTERPHQPTVFEYYRKEKSVAITNCFVILGKDKLNVLAYSDHSEYAYNYRALVKYSSAPYDDKVTLNNFRNVIVTAQPRLGIINFASTDNAAHSGNWSQYVNALHTADSLTYEVWRTLQSDPFYRGQTTLIVTGDHGRHLDRVADGFKSHGDTCEGCRHIATMIIGPDTPAGHVDSTKRLQIDIAPTVGRFLNFPTFYSTGTIISSAVITNVKSEGLLLPQKIELMQNYPNPFNPSTTLCFSLQNTEFITLKVYTVLGEEVARFAEGITLPGEYKMKWDAGGYSSGIYLCRLATEGNNRAGKRSVFVNKMILNSERLSPMPKQYDPSMHSAEHILNQTMVRMFDCGRCINAHVEKKKSRIDYRFNRNLTELEVAEIERRVNEIIAQDLEVKEEFLPRSEAAQKYNLHKLPDDSGDQIRIVLIGDYDACPCRGPHVTTTREIGVFSIASTSYEDGLLRIRFRLRNKEVNDAEKNKIIPIEGTH